MEYIAILGRQPELGLVELESLLGAGGVKPFGRYAALLAADYDLNDLGGVQKIGEVLYRGPARDLNETPILPHDLPLKDGKTTIGLSYYGLKATQRFVVAAGMTLKKRLKSHGPVRIVAPQSGTALTAAQVKFNALTRDGFELLVCVHKQEMVVAITTAFQDIDWYATRDYQRPTRSAKVGMLPPKLAQIMVNTTDGNPVYDPFCGTGVVLQESLLLGRDALGSDTAQEMVQATRANLEWLGRMRSGLPEWSVSCHDARTVRIQKSPLAIVSEGYLGPNLVAPPDASRYRELASPLQELYASSLLNWAGQIPAGTDVTITAPVWNTTKGWRGLDLVDQLPDMGYTLRSFAHADSRALVYRRTGQMVGRQLLILRKN